MKSTTSIFNVTSILGHRLPLQLEYKKHTITWWEHWHPNHPIPAPMAYLRLLVKDYHVIENFHNSRFQQTNLVKKTAVTGGSK